MLDHFARVYPFRMVLRRVGLSPRVRHEFRHSRLGSDFALDSLVQV